jgi:hypothetical protein
VKHAAVALVLGVIIYLTTRDDLVIHALGAAHLPAPDLVRYQLPDALWQFAFCSVIYAIWRDPRALLLPLALGIAAECTVGTFDPLDVIALVIGSLASWFSGARAGAASSLRSPSRETCALPAAAARASSCS